MLASEVFCKAPHGTACTVQRSRFLISLRVPSGSEQVQPAPRLASPAGVRRRTSRKRGGADRDHLRWALRPAHRAHRHRHDRRVAGARGNRGAPSPSHGRRPDEASNAHVLRGAGCKPRRARRPDRGVRRPRSHRPSAGLIGAQHRRHQATGRTVGAGVFRRIPAISRDCRSSGPSGAPTSREHVGAAR